VDLPSMLTEMTADLHRQESPSEVISLITQYARGATEGDAAGVLFREGRGRVHTPLGTGQEVYDAHQLQAQLQEGPCFDVVTGTAHVLFSGHVGTDQRWPRWGPLAERLGFASVVSVPLETHERRFGSLNVYAVRPDAFDGETARVLALVAAHASVALASAQSVDGLRAALDSRTVIGQAQGMVMQTLDLDAAAAFDHLVRLSHTHDVKLAALAADIVRRRVPLTSEVSRTR
jgi:GAF domain-containing protein